MEHYLPYLSHFKYIAFFILLLLCGMGLPIPEDVVIVIGGYLAHRGDTEFIPTLLTLYVGAICGDFCLYWIGRRFGQDIISHKKLKRFFSAKRIKAINYYFHRYGNRTFFFARFLVGLRSTIFLSSGAFKVHFKKVLLMNGMAASISVSFVTCLGYFFGNQLDQLLFWMKRVERVLILVVGMGIGLLIMAFWRFLKKQEQEIEQESPELEAPPKDEGIL
ncbi:MAG: DedA family protein [Deltaproteobacteria bacterium]|nr:DedA family protein [Deltaproteobacteria bacterium]